MDLNFLQYASYVIRGRAIPHLDDGLKPVQRRILYSLHANDDGKFIKVANIVGIRDNKPVDMDVPGILKYNTTRLVEILRRELMHTRRRLTEEIHHQALIRLFVEHRIYQQIENCSSATEMQQVVLAGMQPFRDQLQRDITHEDVEMLLGIPIRRISLLDLEKNRKEVERLGGELAEVEQELGALVPYVIRTLRGLLRKYGADFPRRTRLAQFGEISERELTANELTIAYDRGKGYIGHKIAGELVTNREYHLAPGNPPIGTTASPAPRPAEPPLLSRPLNLFFGTLTNTAERRHFYASVKELFQEAAVECGEWLPGMIGSLQTYGDESTRFHPHLLPCPDPVEIMRLFRHKLLDTLLAQDKIAPCLPIPKTPCDCSWRMT